MPNSPNPFIQSLERLENTLNLKTPVVAPDKYNHISEEELEDRRAKVVAKYKADDRYNKLPAMEFSMSVNNRLNKINQNLERLRAPVPLPPEPDLSAFSQRAIFDLTESSGYNRADRMIPKDIGQLADPNKFAKGSIAFGEASFLKKQREFSALQPNFNKAKDLVAQAMQSNDPALLKKARTILEQDNLVVSTVKGAKDMFDFYNSKIADIDRLQRDFDVKEKGLNDDFFLKGANSLVTASRIPASYKLRGNTVDFQQNTANVRAWMNQIAELGAMHGNRAEFNNPFYNDDVYNAFKKSGKVTESQRYKNLSSGLGYIQNAYDNKLKGIQDQIQKLNTDIGISNQSLAKEFEEFNAKANADSQAFRAEGQGLKGSKDNDKLTRFNARVESFNKTLKLTEEKFKGKSAELDAKIQQRDQLIKDFTNTQAEFKKVPEALFSTDPALREQYDTEMRLNKPGNYDSLSFEEKARNRVGNVVKNVLVDKIAWLGEKVGVFDTEDALDYKTKHSPEHYLKDHDELGRPIYSDRMHYTDQFGESHNSLGAILETGTTVFADMAITALVTRGIASAAAGAVQVGKATTLRNLMTGGVSGAAQRALTTKILNNAISSRALTFGAVTATTYPKFYFDNIGKFKTLEEAHDASAYQTGIEAATESFIPQVNFFKGTSLGPVLGEIASMPLKQAYNFVSNTVRKGIKEGFRGLRPTLSKTAKLGLLNFVQEGIIEEQAAFIANAALDQHFKKENSEYEVQNILDGEHMVESLIDSSLGMIVSSVLGLGGNWQQAKSQHRYDFSDPKSLVNYQWNIANMSETIKNEIKNDGRLDPAQKLKAYTLVDTYRKTFEHSMAKTQKPSEISLGRNQLATYTHFGSTILAQKAQEKLLEQQVLETTTPDNKLQEEIDKYEQTINKIEVENERWEKLPTEKKEEQWFGWFKNSHKTPVFSAFNRRLEDTIQNYKSIKEELPPRMQSQYEKVITELETELPTRASEQIKQIEEVDSKQDAFVYQLLANELVVVKPYMTEEKYKTMRDMLSEKFTEATKEAPVEEEVVTETPAPVTPTEAAQPEQPAATEEGETPATSKYDEIFATEDANELKKKLKDIFEDIADVPGEIAELQAYKARNPDMNKGRETLINRLLERLERLNGAPAPTEPAAPTKTAEEAILDEWEEAENALRARLQGKSNKVIEAALAKLTKEYEAKLDALEGKTPATDSIEAKKADIERRREASLLIRPISTDEGWEKTIEDENIVGKSLQDFYDKVNAKYDAELAALEQPTETEEVPSELMPTDPDDVKGEYSPDYRPISGFITISDELDFTNKKNQDIYVTSINNFLDKTGPAIADYNAKLISNEKMFRDLGIDIDAIRAKINEYWALESRPDSVKEKYQDELIFLFKGTIVKTQVAWHLDDRVSALNKETYGLQDAEDKFDKVTLRGFRLLITHKDGRPVKINMSGNVGDSNNHPFYVYRALPKVVLEDDPKAIKKVGKYKFENIEPYSMAAIQSDLEQMYNLQNEFLKDNNKEVPLTDLKISTGFAKSAFKEDPIVGLPTVLLEDDPLTKMSKNMIVDEEGHRVLTKLLSATDKRVIATLISKGDPANVLYIAQITHVRSEDQKAWKGKPVKEIEELLEENRYNIHKKSIKESGTRILPRTVKGDEIIEGKAMPYIDFLRSGNKMFIIVPKPTVAGNKKIYFSLGEPTIDETAKDPSEDDSVENEFNFSRLNTPAKVTARQELSAYTWFTRSFLSRDFDLNLSFLDNPRAFATFTDAAITLYTGADYTMLYHEAWHRFTQHYLTKEEKNKLYGALKSFISNKAVAPSERRDYEEALAEGMRSFMLSDQKTITITIKGRTIVIDAEKPKEAEKPLVAWYKRLFNLLRGLFSKRRAEEEDLHHRLDLSHSHTQAEDLIRDYMLQASKTNTVREADPKNAMFKELDTIRKHKFTVGDDEVEFDYGSLYELNEGIDALFVQHFNALRKPDENGKRFLPEHATFTAVSQQKAPVRDKIGKRIYNLILRDFTTLKDRETSEQKKLEYQAVIDNFDYFIKNANSIRHEFTNLYKQFVDGKLEELQDEESRIEIAEVYSNKMSQQELATENVINLIKLIPVTDKEGKAVISSTWKLPKLSNFNKNWVVLATNLSQMTYPEMLVKIEELSRTTNPNFKFLLESLPPDRVPKGSPTSMFMLKHQFEQVFNMPKVDEMLTILGSEESGMIVKFIEAGTSSTRTVIEGWSNEIDDFSNKALFKQFPTKQDAKTNRIEFLKAIGVEFTELEEVQKKLLVPKRSTDLNNAIGKIYDHLDKVRKSVVVDNPLEEVAKPRKKLGLGGEGLSLNTLANLEIDTNQSLSDDMILRADGETSWKYNQYNYITKLTKALDGPYEELAELYPQFDIIKNPAIRNSNWFSTLFSVDENNTVKRTEASSLEYLKTGGLKSEELGEDGEISINLTRHDKLVMDFYSFLQSGTEESVRFGDKSTTSAIRIVGGKQVKIGDTATLKDMLYTQLIGELANIKHLDAVHASDTRFPSHSKQDKYVNPTKKSKDKFVFFSKILSAETRQKLVDENIQLDKYNQWTINNEDLKGQIMEEFEEYFRLRVFEGTEDEDKKFQSSNKIEPFKRVFMNTFPASATEQKLVPSSHADHTLDSLALWYYMYSTLNRMDQFNILYGDPRNYKNGSDVFKRLSAYSATGKFPSLNEATLETMNGEERYGRTIENLFSSTRRNWTNKFNMVQFKNMPVNLNRKEFLSEDMAPDLKKAWEAYFPSEGSPNKGDRADASGAVTLDFYKALNMFIGSWDIPQQDAYQDQVDFVRVKQMYEQGMMAAEEYMDALTKARASYSNLLTVFNPKKWQYAGSIYSTHTVASKVDMRAFLKFSIMPLIPSNIEGTELEQVNKNMYANSTDLYVFQSGSKMTIDQQNEDFTQWSSSDVTFNPTKLDLRNFKEQLPIENKMKEEGIFASQMRKLLSVGLFEHGQNKHDTTDYDRYKLAVSNITRLVMEDLKDKFATPKKLITYLKDEFDKRELPENVKDFLEFFDKEDTIVNSLDTSFQSFFIQNVLFSIVNKKLIQQKYSGGQFVQLPNAGYRSATFKDIEKFRDDDLSIYKADGKTKTRSMQIKIAFSPKYEPLLNIEWKGKRIGDRTTLNSLIRDPEFLEKHGAKFTIVGCRIPVQGFSTIESMVVAEFLDPIAGQIIIVPNGLTIKSGSDFDIDKLNLYEPHLDGDGNLISSGVTAKNDIIKVQKILQDQNNKAYADIQTLKENMATASAEFKETDKYRELLIEIDEAKQETPVLLLSGKFTSFDEVSTSGTSEKLQELLDLKDLKDLKADKLTKYMEEGEKAIKKMYDEINARKKFLDGLMASEINSLIGSVSNIILAPHNATNLITENELLYINSAYKGQGVPDKDDSTLDIGDVIDPVVSNKVFENNTVAKSSLGIAAKSNPLFAMFLEAGMKIIDPSPTTLLENRNTDGSVSMSSLHTQPYSGRYNKYNVLDKETKEIDVEKSNTGPMYIPKLLSEFISATVDVANDARVGEIRFNKMLAPIYIYGVMKGTHLFDMVDLLLDEDVQKLVTEYQKRDSIAYQHYVKTNIKPKQQSAALSKNKLLTNTILNSAPEALHKFDDDKNFLYMETAKNVVSNPEGVDLKAIRLAEFVILLDDSNKLSNLSAAISWDTNTSKSFVEFAYSNEQINKLIDQGFFDAEAINKLKTESVIAPLDVAEFVQDQFSGLFSIISKPDFMEPLLALYDQTYGVRLEDFARDYTNDFFTFLYQNHSKNSKGESLYEDLIIKQRLLDKTNVTNIENQFRAIVKKVPNLRELNSFVDSITFKKNRNSLVIAPRLKNANIDVHTFNLLHQDILKLLDSSYSTDPAINTKLSEVTSKLLLATSLLNGVNKTFGSFIEIIPTSVYTQTLRDLKDPYAEIENEFLKRFIQIRRTKYFKRAKQTMKIDRQNKFKYFIDEESAREPEEKTDPVLGEIKLNIIEDWVQAGTATTTVRNESYHKSFYKGDGIYKTEANNLVDIMHLGEIQLIDDALYLISDMPEPIKLDMTLDQFAAKEGFGTWDLFKKNAKYAGKTLISGGPVHFYSISPKNVVPLSEQMTDQQELDAMTSTPEVTTPQEAATETTMSYKYYGSMYDVVVDENGKGIDVKGYKGKADSKAKLLNSFNENPKVDPQVKEQPRFTSAPIQPAPISTDYSMTFADGTVITTPFQLNEEQHAALLSLEQFIKSPKQFDNQITLLGYAGTGKTSIIGIFDKYLKKKFYAPYYSSPTHRANAVTKMKNPTARVLTLHKLFGLSGLINLEDGDYDLKDLQFGKQNKPKIQPGDLLIVDEASMVNDALYEMLEDFKNDFGVKIIYVGDPAQLKPVRQSEISKVFRKGTQLQLTKVERTTDNPILDESTGLRSDQDFKYQTRVVGTEGVEYTMDAALARQWMRDNFTSKEFAENKLYFRVLSATNSKAQEINKVIRNLLFDNASEQIVPGDILMGYSNFDVDYVTGEPMIINSGDYQVVSLKEGTKKVRLSDTDSEEYGGYHVTLKNILNPDDREKTIFIVHNNEEDAKITRFIDRVASINKEGAAAMARKDFKTGAMLFASARALEAQLAFMKELKDKNGKVKVKKTLDYGYSHTIHKSQGGTYNKVLILADTIPGLVDFLQTKENFSDEDNRQYQQQLKYVAMSRASEYVYVQTTHKLGNPDIISKEDAILFKDEEFVDWYVDELEKNPELTDAEAIKQWRECH